MLGLSRYGATSSRRQQPLRRQERRPLRLEELELRCLLTGYAPAQILHAYGFDQLTYDGSGQTIAIVDAFDNPSLTYDLGIFDQLFGLPDPVLTIAQPRGQPTYDMGWGLEIDLDVQWAHAIAPGANILLVEARTNSNSDLMAAVDYARQQPGVVAVSMSWATEEFATETLYDSYLTTPPGHIGGSGLPGGITFVAASGDTGAGVDWPAASPNVLSIGGTTLTLDDNNEIVSETGWSRSGGGVSNYEPQPDYQVPFQMFGMRTTPDFAYNADLSTPFWVYSSAYGGMQAVYGTSAGAPQWAGLIALVDQGLALNNICSLDGPTQAIPALYNLASVSSSTYYHDIVDGNNGYQAGPGYDLVSGIGSPIADQIVEGLVNGGQPPSGGARGPRAPGRIPFRPADWSDITFPLVSPPRLVPVPAPLPGHPVAVERSTLPKQGDSSNHTVALLLVTMANPATETGQTSSGTSSSPSSTEKGAGDSNAAMALVQPAPTSSSRMPESRIKSGGGDTAARGDDSAEDGPAQMVAALASDSNRSLGTSSDWSLGMWTTG